MQDNTIIFAQIRTRGEVHHMLKILGSICFLTALSMIFPYHKEPCQLHGMGPLHKF